MHAKDKDQKVVLFNGIDPKDVAQGALGDCWLMAAIATLTEFPDDIRRLFLTKEYNPEGEYKMQLFDAPRNQWKVINIRDTSVPSSPKTCNLCVFCCTMQCEQKELCAHPNGNELWVMLLEKAFAQLAGSYANLNGS